MVVQLTLYEEACLRLKAWKACEKWGTRVKPSKVDDDGKVDFGEFKSWDWSERMKRADELYEWMISDISNQPSEDSTVEPSSDESIPN